LRRRRNLFQVEQLGKQRQQMDALQAEVKQVSAKHAGAWQKVNEKAKQMAKMKKEFAIKVADMEKRINDAEQVG
jgi:hypothetical protein